MESIIGTVLDTIIIYGFRKLRPIDNYNNIVFKIKRAYLHLFNLTYLLFISICSFLIFHERMGYLLMGYLLILSPVSLAFSHMT